MINGSYSRGTVTWGLQMHLYPEKVAVMLAVPIHTGCLGMFDINEV